MESLLRRRLEFLLLAALLSANCVTISQRDDQNFYPGVVAVGDGHSYECSGSIVGEKLVLTSAHCDKARYVYLGNRIGAPQLAVPVDGPPEVHPTLDVMLLRLRDPLPSAAVMQLVPSCITRRLDPEEYVTLVGYGYRYADLSGATGIRAFARVYLNGLGCSGLPGNVCQPTQEFTILATPGMADTCKGDSGGPVLLDEMYPMGVLGITRRSISETGRCTEGGVYVRADAIVPWAQSFGARIAPCPENTGPVAESGRPPKQ